MPNTATPIQSLFQNIVQACRVIQWKEAALQLRSRFVADQLPLTASSLTFTTIIALVPLLTVLLAAFTVFPMFGKFQVVLQQWLVESLVPDNIARQVLGYLTQFSGKASRLGGVGVVVLFGTALALILTIDRTLNRIWRVQRPRPLRQRVLIYWGVVTLGPLLLAAILTITSYLVTASRSVVGAPPDGFRLLLNLAEVLLLAGGVAALFRSVPNTLVKWSHAWLGGLLVSLGFEVAKKLLTLYLAAMPTYSVVYGAFATVPILLIWIYLAWLIVLCGAVLVASLPGLLRAERRTSHAAGWPFQLALEVLAALDQARAASALASGQTLAQLAAGLHLDPADLAPVLHQLIALDWIAQIDEINPAQEPRFVLLADLDTTRLEPLIGRFLAVHRSPPHPVWRQGIQPDAAVRTVL